jgi:hypothetical protein
MSATCFGPFWDIIRELQVIGKRSPRQQEHVEDILSIIGVFPK